MTKRSLKLAQQKYPLTRGQQSSLIQIKNLMTVEQIYTGCLAEAAYYIESNGEAAIIDPLREVAPYIERAERDGARIKYVLETHFHADFVSGHLDLARKTGATIIYGPTASPEFTAHVATDGERIPLGKITLEVMHTPGHTMESTTYLLRDENNKEVAIFTGDTLFIGDVGRPDLAVTTNMSREDLAGKLFDSLRNKIMPLPDHVTVYPGHGAGSACGKKMDDATVDSLGHQKCTNYALREDMDRKEFIVAVTEGLAAPPQYFPKNALMNREGYRSLDDILTRGIVPLDVKSFMTFVDRDGALILDTRPRNEFMEAFVPGAIWIGIEDSFAPWVGTLIPDLETPIVFLASPGKEEEVVTRLARVGYENTLGFLDGGMRTWTKAHRNTDHIDRISPKNMAYTYRTTDIHLIDVRRETEFDAQHITRAKNFPLETINRTSEEMDKNSLYYLYCQGGYRSVIAASMLKKAGFNEIVNVDDGFDALVRMITDVTEYQEPMSML
jgi:glyoxylase-like metal-dependent hydrolase (beta-lactamase superfamily II)/rhodanese-related sulfurtransferase